MDESMEEQIRHDQWSGKTDGRPWMQRTLIAWLRVVDIRLLYGVMGLVIPFYMLFCRRAYLAGYYFFRHRIGESPLRSFYNVYLSQYHLGQVVLDRFAVYAGRHFDIEIENYALFQSLSAASGGFLQLSSHVGNYELAGYTLAAKDKPLNALVFSGETETVMRGRSQVFAEHNIRMIPVREDLSHIFMLSNALRDGEIVSMPGDRIFGSQKSVVCDFLGAPAPFPLGPFALAVQREVPVLTVFVMKETTWKYRIFIDRLDACPETGTVTAGTESSQKMTASDAVFPMNSGQNRRQRMEELARRFAHRLEQIVRRYPTQWYNFYEFWQQ